MATHVSAKTARRMLLIFKGKFRATVSNRTISTTTPYTAAEAAKKLGIQGGKARKFEVRYLTVKQPAGLPQGDYQAVGRERIDKDGPEAMYKVRGPESDAARAVLANVTPGTTFGFVR